MKVKSVAKKSRIKIDVNPDNVGGPWKILVKQKTNKGVEESQEGHVKAYAVAVVAAAVKVKGTS